MDRPTSDMVIVIWAVSTICITVLVGYYIAIRNRRHLRELEVMSAQDLAAELEAMRTEFGTQIAELQERVDFAERMLAQGRVPELEGGRTPPEGVGDQS